MQHQIKTPIQHVIYETNNNQDPICQKTKRSNHVTAFQNSFPMPNSSIHRENIHQQTYSQPSFILKNSPMLHQKNSIPFSAAPNIQNRPDLWGEIQKLLKSPQNNYVAKRSQQSLFNLVPQNKQSFILEQNKLEKFYPFKNQAKIQSAAIPVTSQILNTRNNNYNEQNRNRAKAFTSYYPNQIHSHKLQQHNLINQNRQRAISGYNPNRVNHAQSYQNMVHHHKTPKSFSRFQYIPYKKKVINFQTRQVAKKIWVPVLKQKLDYYQVEHITQYQAIPYQQTVVETVPIQKIKTKVQYQLIEKKIIHLPDQCYSKHDNKISLYDFQNKKQIQREHQFQSNSQISSQRVQRKQTFIDVLSNSKAAHQNDHIHTQKQPNSLEIILEKNQNTMTKKQQKNFSGNFILDNNQKSGIERKTVGFLLDDEATPNRNSQIKIQSQRYQQKW